ncbi:hypothetical protein PVAND_008915 [Polypedilum vanderplanki]|uniref:Uncharacterized protein n=1 Tax=Polypedilum vanderplanki TaxID=319348 RepID=A0A9J6CBG9_POLVA|nr:hypothetical protein PVAND_008915 [Polypedilum vanderplanki]
MFVKFSIFVICLSSVHAANINMVEELLNAQRELSIAHEFTELYMLEQLKMWVDNLTIITQETVLPGFFDARDEIITIIDDTFEYINSFESNSCKRDVHWRWERQSTIIGSRLQFCIRESHRIITMEYYDLNLHHPRGQQLAAHTQNQGLNILSQNSIFEESGTIYRNINRRLRELLGRAMPWVSIMDELLELQKHHIDYANKMIKMCYTMVVDNFKVESNNHRERIENC